MRATAPGTSASDRRYGKSSSATTTRADFAIDLLPSRAHEQKVHETEEEGSRRRHARAEAVGAPALPRRPRAPQAAPAQVQPVAREVAPVSSTVRVVNRRLASLEGGTVGVAESAVDEL